MANFSLHCFLFLFLIQFEDKSIIQSKFKNFPDAWKGRPTFASYDQFMITHDTIKIVWIPAGNTGFNYKTEVQFCERNDTAVLESNMVYYPTLMNHTYFNSTYQQDSYWQNCQQIQLTTQTYYTFTSLQPRKPYKFRVRQTSTTFAANSAWSDFRILITKLTPLDEQHEYAHFYTRGTGAKNHNSSIIMVDDQVILDHAIMRGLYLAVFSRYTLKKVYSGIYDMMTEVEPTEINPIADKIFKNYTFDTATQTYTTNEITSQTYKRVDKYSVAHQMARKIKQYDNKYFIVIVSQNAWELNFSKELGDALVQCGALNILEIATLYSPIFGEKTQTRGMADNDPLVHSNLYHPYAFVGIPGLPSGKAFESLRSNQGFHMSIGTYAYAELRVRLKFNRLLGLYVFDQNNYQFVIIFAKFIAVKIYQTFHRSFFVIYKFQTYNQHQYMAEFGFQDTYQAVNKAKDRSLTSSFPYLVMNNMTSYFDWKTSIYLEGNRKVYYTNATGNFTKADLVYLQGVEKPYRYDYQKRLNVGNNLTWVHEKNYYSYVHGFIYDDGYKDCPPPYTNYANPYCFNYTLVQNNPPEIFKCYTGIFSQYCPNITQTVELDFNGYMQ